MKRALLPWVALGLTAVASIALAATLDVRTGLWELNSSGETSGTPPIPPEVMQRMTAEQRAAIMTAMANAGKPQVIRSCITEKALQRGLDFNAQQQAQCTRTVQNSTPRQVDVHMECNGPEKATGNFHIEAADRQTISGRFDMVVSNGPNTMTIKRTLQGKWLGSDCGNVKPREE